MAEWCGVWRPHNVHSFDREKWIVNPPLHHILHHFSSVMSHYKPQWDIFPPGRADSVTVQSVFGFRFSFVRLLASAVPLWAENLAWRGRLLCYRCRSWWIYSVSRQQTAHLLYLNPCVTPYASPDCQRYLRLPRSLVFGLCENLWCMICFCLDSKSVFFFFFSPIPESCDSSPCWSLHFITWLPSSLLYRSPHILQTDELWAHLCSPPDLCPFLDQAEFSCFCGYK